MSAKSKRWPPETCKSDRKQKNGEALVKYLGGNALEPESASRKTPLETHLFLVSRFEILEYYSTKNG